MRNEDALAAAFAHKKKLKSNANYKYSVMKKKNNTMLQEPQKIGS